MGNGHGKWYWKASVEESAKEWSKFNTCQNSSKLRITSHVEMLRFTECKRGANVVVMKCIGAGHTWPGSTYRGVHSEAFKNFFGETTMEVDANELMYQFFKEHVHERPRHTALQGDQCYNAVNWAMTEGMRLHPQWYESMGLDQHSTFESFQSEL